MRRLLAFLLLLGSAAPATAAPEGTLNYGLHVTLAARWLDPAETEALITPFMVLYAIHDALVKPMPGNYNAPSLAESWTASKNGLTYEFVIRKGVKFHNGDPVTADDVKFSFDRYKGASAKLLKDRVREVQIVDPGRVRIHLKEPWPDFMTFYGTSATGAAWIVPKKYVEKVGDDGFKKAPIGAGPYKVISFNPGVELVMEAFDGYWRKAPRRQTPGVPQHDGGDHARRRAQEGRGGHRLSLCGPVAEEIKRTPGLRLVAAQPPGVFWLDFPSQFDPKSPWHDRRVRLAASHALDRQALNQAETLGFSHPPGAFSTAASSSRRPSTARLRPGAVQEASRRGRLSQRLRRRGPHPLAPLQHSGRGRRQLSRGRRDSRAAAHDGACDVPDRVARAAAQGRDSRRGRRRGQRGDAAGSLRHQERDLRRRHHARGGGSLPSPGARAGPEEARGPVHQIQQVIYDQVTHVPVYELAFLWGVGPRVEEAGVNHIKGFAYSGPYEDLRLKKP